MFKHHYSIPILLVVLTLGFMSLPMQIVNGETSFVIAWDYPDTYGQGIYSISPDENSTGVWSHIVGGAGFLYTGNATALSVNATSDTAIRLEARVIVNCTFLDVTEGDPFDFSASEHPVLNLIRLNVTVSCASLSNFSYSIANMTYDTLGGDLGSGMWWYSYVDVLNFILTQGVVYTIVITYEVFYPEELS